jgi:hypothetical protein
MFARLSLLVLLLTASLGAASPSSIQGTAAGALSTAATIRSTSLLKSKKTTRIPLISKRTNSTRVVRSLPVLPILGQVLSAGLNLQVDICIDLSVKLLGIATVNVFATANLAASISSRGISVTELAVVQAYLAVSPHPSAWSSFYCVETALIKLIFDLILLFSSLNWRTLLVYRPQRGHASKPVPPMVSLWLIRFILILRRAYC